jgi:fumarate hydratase, class II
MPAVKELRDAIAANAGEWNEIVKIGRTHMQDATPLTLGEEWSGYEGMLTDNIDRLERTLDGVYRLALGGTLGHRH